MTRVNTLYRVSTKGQVDKDDIPMQKKACHEFADKMDGWVIIKEYYEKGVSGFKVSAEERDAIQDLKASAERNEFDVLLIFMFDRLGRRQNETPFVVEWFTQHGIEVWSVQEGQQRFENEADYLINYMRYWQANGESRKTSTRVKTRLKQLTEEGRYTGGVPPFGYKLVKSGEVNKKGRELKELAIDEFEAPIVREIFDKTLNEGYGSYQMSEYLNSRGIRTHNGSLFQCVTINRMLKNKLYCGYYVTKSAISPHIESIQIIDEPVFDQVQMIVKQRSRKNDEKQQIAKNTKGRALLSGNIYCAHCGKLLNTTSHEDVYINKEGKEHRNRRVSYICNGKAMKRSSCNGQGTYVARKIDDVVLEIMRGYFKQIKQTPKTVAIEKKYKQHISDVKKQLKTIESNIEKDRGKLHGLTD